MPPQRGVAQAIRTGWLVFLAVMALVILEYIIAIVLIRNAPLMVAMNVVDAGLIMIYFMHISRLWRGREGE